MTATALAPRGRGPGHHLDAGFYTSYLPGDPFGPSFLATEATETSDTLSPNLQLLSTSLAPAQEHQSPAGSQTWISYGLSRHGIRRNHLWGMPENAPTEETSAIPYILAGRDSFSSFLYYETMVMVARALRAEIPGEILSSVLRYKIRHATFEQVLNIVTRVLDALLHGTSQGTDASRIAVPQEQPRTFPDQSSVKTAILEEIASSGTPETEYLNTWGVERYLQDSWGLLISSNSVRIRPQALLAAGRRSSSFAVFPDPPYHLGPNIVPGFSRVDQMIFHARPLVEKIKLGAVSLGEGPRWHISSIDDAVESFLKERGRGMEVSTQSIE